jgi:hypothetical protein
MAHGAFLLPARLAFAGLGLRISRLVFKDYAFRDKDYAFRDKDYAFRDKDYAFRDKDYAFRDKDYAFRV